MDTIDTLIIAMALFQYSQGCYADITSDEFISLPEEEQEFNKICYERANELLQYHLSLLPEDKREEILNIIKQYESNSEGPNIPVKNRNGYTEPGNPEDAS